MRSARADPAGNSAYDRHLRAILRWHQRLALCQIRVISFNPDSYSEGIPDAWRTTYFGSADPSAGPNRHANDDFDRDGFSNVQEYLLGSDPTDSSSNLRITSFGTTNIQWQAKGYEVYELYSSTNLTVWTSRRESDCAHQFRRHSHQLHQRRSQTGLPGPKGAVIGWAAYSSLIQIFR